MSINGFLSYAHEDIAVAERLHRELTLRGCSLWFDQTHWDEGQSVDDQVLNAIREATYFISLLTPTSVSKDGYVRKEIALALNVRAQFNLGEAFLIPVRVTECSPLASELGGRTQFIDLYPDWEAGVSAVAAATPSVYVASTMANSAFAAHQALCSDGLLKEIAEAAKSRWSIAVILENLLSRTSALDPQVVSRKSRNIRAHLRDLSACLELHFVNGCGELDPKTRCRVCGANGSIVHGALDVGGKSPMDYNDNYIVWCKTCFWSDFTFEVDYLGRGALPFNYDTNMYG